MEFNVRRNGLLSIRDHLNSINTQIDEYAKENQNVLIHCVYGQTRSCSCAIGYFIWKDRIRFDEAFQLVQSQREECEIPFGMEHYLREYERQLLDGVKNESIDASCCNSIVKILCECDKPDLVRGCMQNFAETCSYCRFGTHITSDKVFGIHKHAIPAFVREDIDLEELKDEIEPHLSSLGLKDLVIDEMNL